MCQQIMNFCVGYMRPLVYAGSTLLFISATFLAVNGFYTDHLYSVIDPELSFWLFCAQLVSTCYLMVITLGSCLAAYYEHKESIRIFAFISSANALLAVMVVAYLSTVPAVRPGLEKSLKEFQKSYDHTDKSPLPLANIIDSLTWSSNSTTADTQENSGTSSSSNATKIWDHLQATKHCCGLYNATEWVPKLPKSCCSKEILKNHPCEIKDSYQYGCIDYVKRPIDLILIASIAITIVNTFLAIVTGIGYYRLYHYSEANTNPY